MSEQSNIIIYQSDDGKIKLETRLGNETVWLTQKQLSKLFRTTPQNITLHLKNIYAEEELEEKATCKKFLQVKTEGVRTVNRGQKQYNLEAIPSVGHRIKSHIATRFCQRATACLKEYIKRIHDKRRIVEEYGWRRLF